MLKIIDEVMLCREDLLDSIFAIKKGELMKARNLIDKSDLEPFKQWLLKQGFKKVESKNSFEVLRMNNGEAIDISVFTKKHGNDKLVVQGRTLGLYRKWHKLN